MRKLVFINIIPWGKFNFHLGYVLSFVTELEIHSYMAKIFLPFLWQKCTEQHLTWLNVVTWPHTGKTWCCNSLAVFLLWLTLTVNMPAVSKSTAATQSPAAPARKPYINDLLSEQTDWGKDAPFIRPLGLLTFNKRHALLLNCLEGYRGFSWPTSTKRQSNNRCKQFFFTPATFPHCFKNVMRNRMAYSKGVLQKAVFEWIVRVHWFICSFPTSS